MDRKWKEKATWEKVLDIIAGIALCVWLIFEFLERSNTIKFAEMGANISVLIVCVCEAISFWKVKRALSYVAIAGSACLIAAVVLQAL